jgi:Zn-dependent peptidase ImmA (M78 family)/DNA-binding XRE family transcriptional regulator
MNVNPQDVNSIFARRLAIARKMAGFSLQRLSDELEGKVTKQAIGKYEKGQMAPSGEVLIALARALGVTVDFLYNEPEVQVELDQIEYRKRARFSMNEQRAIEAKTLDFLERYAELEECTMATQRFDIELSSHQIENEEDVEQAAQEFRSKLGLGDGPILGVLELLEEHGVKVLEVDAPDSFDGMNAKALGNPVVVLNRAFPVVRKRFSALHEMARYVLAFGPQFSEKDIEKLCHRFAGAVLIPATKLKQELATHRSRLSLSELILLKEYWGISIKAILVRSRDLGIISNAEFISELKVYNAKGYASAEPGFFPVAERAIRFKQLLFRAISEEVISLNYAATLANMKVAEMRSQFQLMR